MIERLCYLCERPIFFEDYCKSNPSESNLLELWESDYTEFRCCHCVRFIAQLESLTPMDLKAWTLLADWAENGRLEKLRILGVIAPSDVREVRRMRANESR